MSTAQQIHDTKVQSLATEYQKNGYVVRISPSDIKLPFDLGTYLPDLLVERGDEHLLIEVKNNATAIPINRFKDIIETVRQYPGWRFLLVSSPSSTGAIELPSEPLSWDAIIERVAHAKRLVQLGEEEASILVYWSAFEALLRRHAANSQLPLQHLSVRALIDYLYSEAELSFEQLEQARQLSTQRNQLAHGFQVQETSKIARTLQQLIDDLLQDWQPNRQAS